ncbi:MULTISPECIES: class I SAM-dependent methyltransferase [unclassified Bacillus (in: firmicutes)]|uniref:class I SAM-dependent methyltransferase n=1 Tax=unclassified Bacillus (in: firmicutes) TaxID=185979 RepID=UPI0008E83FDF|nr:MULTISPECIES: class I SAM-dependent methyltransferase [unclassified Bacillus (in: firmicutes)]SFI05354.1 Methyltransferase domain-containing protein [Bacillus sp. 71mf]SFS79571.1 Methyltransferase domain-containing protein [Bacillus sp. 103mf]
MNRIQHIRQKEKEYHEHCYANHKLFEEGSWLYKPVSGVIEMMNLFQNQQSVTALDLGCGVGRNSIPIAQRMKAGKVVCVDLLSFALHRLQQYSYDCDVADRIQTVESNIEDYQIIANEYDYIVAVSSLEHVPCKSALEEVLHNMKIGTKDKGVNYIVINSSVEEIDMNTKIRLDPLFEVNLSTEEMLCMLGKIYKGWEELNVGVKPLEYHIVRDEQPILLKTNAITCCVKKTIW